jgi:hypothetical protein
VQIVDTNSPMFLFADQVDSDLSDWIRAQLASPKAQQATWRFASAHEPGYSEAWSVEKVELDYHFVEVEAGCDELTIKAIRIPADAEPFDTLVVKKTNP